MEHATQRAGTGAILATVATLRDQLAEQFSDDEEIVAKFEEKIPEYGTRLR
ncbi:MAG: hypothetical protein U0792_07890 [Gemmataceae bacterium]